MVHFVIYETIRRVAMSRLGGANWEERVFLSPPRERPRLAFPDGAPHDLPTTYYTAHSEQPAASGAPIAPRLLLCPRTGGQVVF